jgi:hypothetical protein
MIRFVLGTLVGVVVGTTRLDERIQETREVIAGILDNVCYAEQGLEKLHAVLQDRLLFSSYPDKMSSVLKVYGSTKKALAKTREEVKGLKIDQTTSPLDFEDLLSDAELGVCVSMQLGDQLLSLGISLAIPHKSVIHIAEIFEDIGRYVRDVNLDAKNLVRKLKSQERYIKRDIRNRASGGVTMSDTDMLRDSLQLSSDRTACYIMSLWEAELIPSHQEVGQEELEARALELMDLVEGADFEAIMDKIIENGTWLQSMVQWVRSHQELGMYEISIEIDSLLKSWDVALKHCEMIKRTRDSKTTTTSTTQSPRIRAEPKISKKDRSEAQKQRDRDRLASLLEIIGEEAAPDSELSDEDTMISEPETVETGLEDIGGPFVEARPRRRRWTVQEVLDSFKRHEAGDLVARNGSSGNEQRRARRESISKREESPPDSRRTYKTRIFSANSGRSNPWRNLGEAATTQTPEILHVVEPAVAKTNVSAGLADEVNESSRAEGGSLVAVPLQPITGVARPVSELMLRDLHWMTEDVCNRMRHVEAHCCQVLGAHPDPQTRYNTERILRRISCALLVLDDLNQAAASAEYEAFSMPGIPVYLQP